MPMDVEKVGKTIAYLRKRAGYTQKDLANRIGISDKAVSKWERGQGLPDIAYLRKLSILLDTDTDSLLSGDVIHRGHGWEGILILSDNACRIGFSTVIYDKPLINFLLSYFLLVGIKKIHIVCEQAEREYIRQCFGSGEDYGVQIELHCQLREAASSEAQNFMILYGRCILYGVDQTRFFQKAMMNRDRPVILALPKKNNDSRMGIDANTLASNKPSAFRKQYDYCSIPFLFIPSKSLEEAAEAKNLSLYADQRVNYVEVLDRGFVDIEINDWNDVQEASAFLKIVQDRCGMNVYCLEEVAWRRGFVSLEQLQKLGMKHQGTAYGAYIESLYHRVKEKKTMPEQVNES